MKHLFIFYWLFLTCCAGAQSLTEEKAAIMAVLIKQQHDWNAGNLESFMNGYWKSDSLVFTGRSGVTRGWDTVMANYRRNYPSVQEMGRLSFTVLHLQVFANQTAVLVGQWKLKRENDEPGGYFTLLWRKINGNWVIIADHTS
ncbi:MAG: hypothetical protein KatS3mg032_0566 [Cyclobacteriaceae bacterium]|nr:MAG: hypothetical protein KatS3mg032_0566 [Cyclobacteriaceae bacterium]